MYAIISSGGKQYKVSEGDSVRIEKIDGNVGDEVVLDKVLMISGEDAVIGSPFVEGSEVKAEITAQAKARKVIVYKFKRKTGYHKKNGHRQPYTELKIKEIIMA